MTRRFAFTAHAKADVGRVLRRSAKEHGKRAADRYAGLLEAGFRAITSDPLGRLTRDCSRDMRGARSLHLRHVKIVPAEERVKSPSHVLYYRIDHDGSVLLIRILHERMDPRIHLRDEPHG